MMWNSRLMWDIPIKAYPWILLVFGQLVIENTSFCLHLCGIILGYMNPYKLFVKLVPSCPFLPGQAATPTAWRGRGRTTACNWNS